MVLFIQEVSGAYASPFFWYNQIKMSLRARKVSGAFEKWASDAGLDGKSRPWSLIISANQIREFW